MLIGLTRLGHSLFVLVSIYKFGLFSDIGLISIILFILTEVYGYYRYNDRHL